MAPGDLKKDLTLYDLPIAVGVILAMKGGQLALDVDQIIFGELSLDGSICQSPMSMALCLAARNYGLTKVYMNAADASFCAHISGINVYGAKDLKQVIADLVSPKPTPLPPRFRKTVRRSLDFEQVKGLSFEKRIMMICATGRHNLLMSGSPGSGKSMLAHRLHTILPDLTMDQYLELNAIQPRKQSGPNFKVNLTPPFRAPHHTLSTAGLVGGGSGPAPGEISLAHHGVLFLDELLEFKKTQLESLRTPLEEGCILLSRAATKSTTRRVHLIGAYNPCPGFMFDPIENADAR